MHRDLKLLLVLVLFGANVVYVVRKDPKKVAIIEKDFESPTFLRNLALIALVAFLGFHSDYYWHREAAKHAVAAFMIAYLAHLDLVFSAFFLVYIFVYFSSGWV